MKAHLREKLDKLLRAMRHTRDILTEGGDTQKHNADCVSFDIGMLERVLADDNDVRDDNVRIAALDKANTELAVRNRELEAQLAASTSKANDVNRELVCRHAEERRTLEADLRDARECKQRAQFRAENSEKTLMFERMMSRSVLSTARELIGGWQPGPAPSSTASLHVSAEAATRLYHALTAPAAGEPAPEFTCYGVRFLPIVGTARGDAMRAVRFIEELVRDRYMLQPPIQEPSSLYEDAKRATREANLTATECNELEVEEQIGRVKDSETRAALRKVVDLVRSPR